MLSVRYRIDHNARSCDSTRESFKDRVFTFLNQKLNNNSILKNIDHFVKIIEFIEHDRSDPNEDDFYPKNSSKDQNFILFSNF